MIGKIETNQRLYLSNVLSFRGKCSQRELREITNKIEKILLENDAKKNGSTVSVTHNILMENGVEVMDFEIMIPLNKEISVPSGFRFISKFFLDNALKIQITGNPSQAQDAVKALGDYIKQNNIQSATPIYVVAVKEAKTAIDIDNMITELYTGVEVIKADRNLSVEN